MAGKSLFGNLKPQFLFHSFMSFMIALYLQTTGKIPWDYYIRSVPAYLYPEQNIAGRVFLEILCIACLALNTILELKGLSYFFFCLNLKTQPEPRFGRCIFVHSRFQSVRLFIKLMESHRLGPFRYYVAGLVCLVQTIFVNKKLAYGSCIPIACESSSNNQG